MIAEVEKIEEILAGMVVARQPEALQRLGISQEYIVSLLRPVVDMLRADAMAAVEEKLRLQRLVEEKEALISELKDEVFRMTIEHGTLSAQLDALRAGKGQQTKTSPVVKTSENSSLPPSSRRDRFQAHAVTAQEKPTPHRRTAGAQGLHQGTDFHPQHCQAVRTRCLSPMRQTGKC